MTLVIGLGKAGCNIAKYFGRYPQYDILSIDIEDNNYENFRRYPSFTNHNDYDSYKPELEFDNNSSDVIFITSGAGRISGASLRILELLKGRSITILYIKPDLEILSKAAKLRERLTFHVLQQYTRSGVFSRMVVIGNAAVENVVGDVPINKYWDKINETIASTFHMINVFNNSTPEVTTFSNIPDTARIQTIGLTDIEKGEDALFYPLQEEREKLYYYAVSSDSLENKPGLYKKITSQVKSKATENSRCSFSIYSTKYEEDYAYSLYASSIIQEENIS